MESKTGEAGICQDPGLNNIDAVQSKDKDFFQDKTPEKEESTLSDFEQYRITDLTQIPLPDPVLKISGETIAVCEDIYALSGAPKSGKSALTGILIAGAISEPGQNIDNLDGVEVAPNNDRKAVVHIDTEQARHKQQYNVRTIIKRAGHKTCPDHYRSYNIRKLDLDKYVNVTTGICEEALNTFGGIHSIWIDGAADYIADVNDPAAANEIIKYFEGLAIEYKTAVFLIIHVNPGTSKERGHLGSQLQRKVGGVIFVKEEDDVSTIEPKYLRYAGKGDIPQLQFKYDKDKGYHVGCGVKEGSMDDDAKAEKKIKSIWSLCLKIFNGQYSCSRGEAIEQIMTKRACQERTAAGDFALMTSAKMINKGSDENYRLNALYNV